MPLIADEKLQYTILPPCDNDLVGDPTTLHIDDFWRRRFYILLASSISVIALLLGGTAYELGTLSCPPPKPGAIVPYSPAPVRYVNKRISVDYEMPKFMGEPRPELDQAWHELLSGTMIRYSEEELLLANNATSIRHRDGGYAGGLGVSHSLHCLKRIKQYLHPEYYYSHEEQDWDELYRHIDHCLESLRQQILCSADVNIYTLIWTPHSKVMPSVKIPQPHACVDWDALHGWMEGRAAKYEDLVRPPASMYEAEEKSSTSRP